MKNKIKIKCPQGNFSFFSAHLDKNVLHLRFRKNLLEHLADLSKRDMISDFANQVSKSGDVKVILLNSDFRETGCEAYTRFFFKRTADKGPDRPAQAVQHHRSAGAGSHGIRPGGHPRLPGQYNLSFFKHQPGL
jgi:hypothetical protein